MQLDCSWLSVQTVLECYTSNEKGNKYYKHTADRCSTLAAELAFLSFSSSNSFIPAGCFPENGEPHMQMHSIEDLGSHMCSSGVPDSFFYLRVWREICIKLGSISWFMKMIDRGDFLSTKFKWHVIITDKTVHWLRKMIDIVEYLQG